MQTFSFKNIQLSRLGFGMMRLPLLPDGKIDEITVENMIRYAIDNGVNYFDTAYPYHSGLSELIAGKILNKFPRNTWYLADKYPGHQYSDHYDPAAIFEEQLKKCQVDYFDFYLLHNVCESCIEVYRDKKWGIIDYFIQQKKLGRIHHLGFSSHADYPMLKEFLDDYGDQMEFCQIQLNYLDWILQKAQLRYQLLKERNIPVWVMEPLRGGKLARLSETDQTALKQLRPDESCASWAFRWLQSLDNIGVILSGMSSEDQMKDNIHTFSANKPLLENEKNILNQIANSMLNMVPCTACRYCCDGCPRQLDIPMLLNSLNDARFASNFTVPMRLEALPEDKLPSACIGCGACTHICPQHIDIPARMKEFSELIPKLPSWKKICVERAEAAKKLSQNKA